MEAGKIIKVLIVDDSLLFREVIARGISSDANIEVIAKAVDPFDARDKILKYRPDVMICDVEMPKMNGIEFLKKLLPQYLLPVIVVSARNELASSALNSGAVDYIAKPDVQSPKSVEAFILDLISKIKIASQSNLSQPMMAAATISTKSDDANGDWNRLIAIGASTGGTEAIYSVLKQLPPNIPGILIVQHIPPMFSRMFAERLNNQIGLTVVEAQSGDIVEPGKVLIAPGDQHMKVKNVEGKYKVEVYPGEKVNGHCPSVDVLFDSVAKEVGSNAIGVILTGMGYDGAKGLLAMRRRGARTIGQDERSSVVYGMPKVAYEIGAVEKQSDLLNIPRLLGAMLRY